jgi:hypothetical protein
MKYYSNFFIWGIILVLISDTIAQPFDIQAGIFHTGTMLEVKAIPSTGINNLVLAGVNFTIRWPNSYNVSLGSVSGPFGIVKNGSEATAMDGTTNYRYQKFTHVVNQNVTWTAGQAYLLLNVPVNQTGVGTGSFELAAATFLPGNGEEWYIEIGGVDRTNPIFNPGITTEVLLPVELSSFTAKVNGNKINLIWQTESETNNYGFEIERQILGNKQASKDWISIGFIHGSGNSNSKKNYFFIDNNPTGASKFSYRLKQIDGDGSVTYSYEIEVDVIPEKFELFQNYPNPFNPSTYLKIAVPQSGDMKLIVYDMLGRKIKEVHKGYVEAGFHEFIFDGSQFASGTYIYRIETQGLTNTKKMLLIK